MNRKFSSYRITLKSNEIPKNEVKIKRVNYKIPTIKMEFFLEHSKIQMKLNNIFYVSSKFFSLKKNGNGNFMFSKNTTFFSVSKIDLVKNMKWYEMKIIFLKMIKLQLIKKRIFQNWIEKNALRKKFNENVKKNSKTQ